jgi:hypothetical protein
MKIVANAECHECDQWRICAVPRDAEGYDATNICLDCLRKAVSLLEQQNPRIQDRILTAIDQYTTGTMSIWKLADALGINRWLLQGAANPGTQYEEALHDLVMSNILEEIEDHGLRYQRKTTPPAA